MLLEHGAFVDSPRVFDKYEVFLLGLVREPGTTFTDRYDFGDDWLRPVDIKQRVAFDLMPKFAVCIGGARARPPEDVGGVGGCEAFLAVMAARNHPEHAHTKHWCGGHFGPDLFDLALTDKDVRNAFRPTVQRRLHQPKP